MKRVAVLSLVAILLALAPVALHAQGLFGSGLPSFGGFMGGSAACGEKCGGPACATNFYVGWMDDPNGVSVRLTEETPYRITTVTDARHHFRLSGLWLGLTQSCPLTENIGIVASGWYLIPSNKQTLEEYDTGVLTARVLANNSWSTKSEWWFVDGLFALGGGNTQLLAGLRYDFFSTKFDRNVGPVGNPADTADFISYGIIPLVGLQYAQASGNSNLVFRMVGIPTLAGSFRYRENIGGVNSLEGSRNYNGGYFFEAFAEYGYKMGSLGDIGFFARYNTTQGKSTASFDLVPGGLSNDYKLDLYRSSWTLGGKFSLSFSLPYM